MQIKLQQQLQQQQLFLLLSGFNYFAGVIAGGVVLRSKLLGIVGSDFFTNQVTVL